MIVYRKVCKCIHKYVVASTHGPHLSCFSRDRAWPRAKVGPVSSPFVLRALLVPGAVPGLEFELFSSYTLPLRALSGSGVVLFGRPVGDPLNSGGKTNNER
ncbi:hypothetical protein P8452_71551 [Trifolium repens]|nr:hypothetical protein P8452_71551 [Trifolium repens]